MADTLARNITPGQVISHLEVRDVKARNGKVFVYFEGYETPDEFAEDEVVTDHQTFARM
ncbi:hypothetical protein [Amycolatopsis thermoflava]|uniref:hypothetical protein n=1 Tax=Amycolatopsis thermoflava TaxID=84480 RepID=UPI0003FB9612|nr:hypothetical protein [Amycolatopsis thermoflava]